MDLCSLVFEEAVQFQVSLHVDGILNGISQLSSPPCAILGDRVSYPIGFHVSNNIAVGGMRLGIHGVDQLDDFCRPRIDDITGSLLAVEHIRLQLESHRDWPAHVEPLPASAQVGVGHTHLDCLAFQLGKHDTDVEHSPPHWCGGIELLIAGDELHAVFLKLLHHICEVQNGATDSVQLVDDDSAHLTAANAIHHPLEIGTVGIFPREPFVLKDLVYTPTCLVLAELDLAFNADAVHLIDGLSAIDCIIFFHIQLPFL